MRSTERATCISLKFARISAASLMLLAFGCNGKQPKPPGPAASEESQPAAATVADAESKSEEVPAVNPAIAELESNGAKVAVKDGAIFDLNFRGIEFNDELANLVAGQDKLTKLTISQSSMTDSGWKQLSKLNALQQLDLRECQVNNAQLEMAVSGMPKLRALRLNGKSGATTVDDLGLKVLAKCPELKALALDHLWIGVDGLKYLVNNKKLAEVYLAGSLVDDEALKLMKGFPGLKKLRLAQTSVSEVGLDAISGLGIEELDISECSQVSDAALPSLGKMTKLRKLNLWRNAVSDLGVDSIKSLTAMEWLNLDNTQVTDGGLGALAGMQKLTFLHLGSTGVSDKGMPELLALKSLKDLKVTRTAVTEAGVKLVEEGIPGVNVQLEYIEGQ